MIGIFDSGVGGMSVFGEIYRLLPYESYLYFSDNAYCPYGEKGSEFVLERSREITKFLLSEGAKIIVVACNTATAAAIEALRREFPVKFIGIEPALKPGALNSHSGIVGVLATEGTLNSTKYLVHKGHYDNVRIVESVGRGWVELVEAGETTGPRAERLVESAVRPLLEEGADSLVLGCTHYPFLMDVIRKVVGPHIPIINPAPAVALQTHRVMYAEGLIPHVTATPASTGENDGCLHGGDHTTSSHDVGHPDGIPNIRLVSSGDPSPLKRICRIVLQHQIPL